MIVGCGRIAGGFNTSAADRMVLTHALAYRRHPRFDLVAVVDPDRERREDFARRWGPVAAFGELNEALEACGPIDVVSVCSPTETHIEVLRRLLGQPVRAVFAEKPLGGVPQQISDIVEAYEKAGKVLAVAFLRRWDKTLAELRNEIAAGAWGAPRAACVLYNRGVVNNGSHAIDLLHFLLGETLRIDTVLSSHLDGVPQDPSVSAVLRGSRGTEVHLVALDGRDFAAFEIQLAFAGGIISIEQGGLYVRLRHAKASEHFSGARVAELGESRATGYGTGLVEALSDVARAIETGSSPASCGASALEAIRITAALRDAALKERITHA